MTAAHTADAFLLSAKTALAHAAPAMPHALWPVTAFVLFVLAVTAAIDARRHIVPDNWIFLGFVILTGALGFYGSWDMAAHHLRIGIEAGLVVWAVNFIWFLIFARDALGMGDGKWTALAVSCFGVVPAVFAWGAGACLGVLSLTGKFIARRPAQRVAFAPFLFVGLIAGLYWLRFRPF
ncbi:MAG: hypothetical protein KGI97_00220 [Alphaproteobacteria bacterium]|nr:hypothetical protein [Alphaproteobacteria bacterium]